MRGFLLAVLSLIGLAWWQPRFVLRLVAAFNRTVLFYVDTAEPVVALTIDDSPHPVVTPRILEVLARYQAHATFFIIGEHVFGNEQVLHRMVAGGHEVGNHHLRDVPSIRLSAATFEYDLLLTHDRLAPFGPVRFFRPASGWFTQRMLQQLERHGYQCVLGSAYPEDVLTSPAYLAQHILLNTRPGSIIILHDGSLARARTVAVLEGVLPELQRRGYRVVTVSQLVAQERRAWHEGRAC